MSDARARVVFVEGISLWAPRLPGWAVARAVLAGDAAPPASAARRPAPELLPPAERRRAPDSVILAIEVAWRACDAANLDPAAVPSVFSTTHGDPAITDYLCSTLASTPLHTSPTKFHNSVHNAAAGYWCIASGCNASYTTVSVFEYSFAVGLLEAFLQVAGDGGPVLYVAYDIESPGPLAPVAASRGLLGVGLVLATECTARSVARLSWSARAGCNVEVTPALPRNLAVVDGNAMTPCLPLFEALAVGAGNLTFATGPDSALDIRVDGSRLGEP